MRWLRPIIAVGVASGIALTLGVIPASAAQSTPSTCTAAGYRAQAKVTYHRTAADTFIDSVSVNVDKRAGAHNKVRIVVKDGDRTVFYYASQPTVTAGPFLFDYTTGPIPTHQQSSSDPMTVDVTFDFDRGTAGTGASPESNSGNDPDGVESGRDESEDTDDSGDSPDSDASGPRKSKHKHSDANPASAEAPTRCTATVRF